MSAERVAVTVPVTVPCNGSGAENPGVSAGCNGVTVPAGEDPLKGMLPSGSVLLRELVQVIRRFVILPRDDAEMVALWVLHAATIAAHEHSPRLFIWAPMPDCGKTTLCGVIAQLLGTEVLGNISTASIYRMIDARPNQTLIMDELDTYLSGEDKLTGGVLNSGWQRTGSRVVRSIAPAGGGDYEPKRYATFGPLVMCKIGARLPHPALASRCLSVGLKRRKASESVERFKERREGQSSSHPELDRLATDVALWSAANVAALASAEPAIPPELQNRAADNWRPLLAVADCAGGNHWPRRARELALALTPPTEPHAACVLLGDIATLRLTRERVSSDDLANRLRALPDRSWRGYPTIDGLKKAIARLLSDFGIKPGLARIDGTPARGYRLAELIDAAERYRVAT